MINYTVISSSAAQEEVSGSIAKILALGNDDAEGTITRIEFGDPNINPQRPNLTGSNYTPTSVAGPVVVPAGTYVEGPIGRVKVDSSTGGFLIYLTNQR